MRRASSIWRVGLVAVLALPLLACDDQQPSRLDRGPYQPLPEAGWPEARALESAPALDGDRGERDLGQLDGKQPSPDGGQLRDDAIASWTWHDQCVVLLNQSALGAAFSAAGYTPPSGTYLLATRLVAGLGQPAFQYYSLAGTALTYSQGHYWPASTVKLTAAVGALRTLGKQGLSGAAQVSFSDDDGSYSGTVKNLYAQAIEVSDNVAYNRLMEIAGFDEMNDQYLVAAESAPTLVLQRRYTHPLPSSSLRSSPPITYSEAGKSGQLPARTGVGQHPECPDEGNCITLLELLEVMRRVTLHGELPAADRLPLAAADVSGLQASLLTAPSDLEAGAAQALGHAVKVYNKPGEVYGDDRLDHGLIVDTVSGQRFLLATSMPYNTTSGADLSELARRALLALLAQPGGGLALQRTAGGAIVAQLDDGGPVSGGRRYTLTLSAAGADSLELWVDGYALPKPAGPSPYFKLTHDFSKSGDRLLIVRASKGGAVVGYRALTVHIN